MSPPRLKHEARLVLLLNGLYHVADALCSVFVGVYFYLLSQDLTVVYTHYLVIYAVTPLAFLAAGWYAQAFDRVHVFRAGLLLHAVYYGAILYLQTDAPTHSIALGALLGITWGLFWAGNNTFTFDVADPLARDYFFGWLTAIMGAARLVAPLIAGAVISFIPGATGGYQLIFGMAVVLYLLSILLSARIPPDRTRRIFHIRRALFPGRDQRDWQMIMAASMTLAGSFNIFQFLLGLLLFTMTENEMQVGGFAAFQALAGIVAAWFVGRVLRPRTRRVSMLTSVGILLVAGAMIASNLTIFTLILFGFMRSVAMPLFGVPHSSVRLDVIDRCAQDPSQRIEYICAWEVPLAVGRVIMMTLLIVLGNNWGTDGLRVALFLLCANRVFTYCFVSQTLVMRDAR